MYNTINRDNTPNGPVNLYAYFVEKNPPTSFNPVSVYPKISKGVFIGPFSSVIGDVTIKENVFLGANTVIRADEGTPFYIGDNSDIQDRVVLHGLKDDKHIVNGKGYSIYIGSKVNIAHGALIHGPVVIGNNVFVGFNATVFNAIVESNCYIDIGAIVTGGVRISENKYVPIGAIINTQAKADNLLDVKKHQSEFSKSVNDINVEFSKAYDLKPREVKYGL